MKLTALILGTGFAGQGHTKALRDVGVEVVGMVGRTPHVLEKVSAELDIPYHSTNWQQALTDLQPDIVSIGTPGGAHVAPILAALKHGCHVFCDKPMAATAADAKKLYEAAKAADVKTAFAASYRYMPHILHAKELVAQGVIGEPQEVECISHFNLNPLIPFGWSHRLDAGGGRLNNNFTHKLSIVLHVLDGTVETISGSVRSDMDRAPVVAGVHNFKKRRDFAPKSADDPNLEWAASDAEWSYTVLAQIDAPQAVRQPVSALFKHSGLQPRFNKDHIVFYGSDAAIYIEGHYGKGPLYLRIRNGAWQSLPLPAHIADTQPRIADDTQRNWTILAQKFVADIRGTDNTTYQTFHDGWVYQEMIEAVRTSNGRVTPLL
ncbi:MAG: Gfo/Idh/MocA family protein [Candidatus Promineifilaceae bacterium]